MGQKYFFIFIALCQLNILLLFPMVITSTPVKVKRSPNALPKTEYTHKNLHHGNNLFSKKSLDFDPEDEIMYNGDDFEKSMEDVSLTHDNSNIKKSLYATDSKLSPSTDVINAGVSKIIMDKNPYNKHDDVNADKKDIVNKIPDNKSASSMCEINQGSKECVCERSCLPNLVHNFAPCQCIEIIPDHSGETDSLSNEISDPNMSNNQQMFLQGVDTNKHIGDVSSSQESLISVCERACIPHKILSQSPCLCDIEEKYKNNNFNNAVSPMKYSYVPTMSTPFSSGTPMYNPSYQSNYYPIQSPTAYNPWSSNYPTTTSYNSLSNSYPSTSTFNQQYDYKPYDSYASQPNYDTKTKCKKACFPFVVKESSPCTCDFNSYKSPYSQSGNSMSGDSSSYSRSSAGSDVDPAYDTFPPTQNSQSYDKPKSQSNNRQGDYSVGSPRSDYYPDDHHNKISYTIPRYIGCYKDEREHGRDLKIDVPIEKLTVDKCVNKCRKKKKRFAGLQYGYLCFCGSRFGRYGKASDQNCTSQCVGDRTQLCGDGQRYSETQFSFSTPDSMDEIKAEEEKRSNKLKAIAHLKKAAKASSKFKKKHKVHIAKNEQSKSTKNLKNKHHIKAIIKSPELDSETQDAAKKDSKPGPKTEIQTKDLNLDNLKNKLKSLWNKTLEKPIPPKFMLSKLNNDDSGFYKTANNNPSTLSLNETDMESNPHKNVTLQQNVGDENESNDEEQDKADDDTDEENDEENDEETEEQSNDSNTTLGPITTSPENDKSGSKDDNGSKHEKEWVKDDSEDDETNFKV